MELLGTIAHSVEQALALLVCWETSLSSLRPPLNLIERFFGTVLLVALIGSISK